MIRRRRTWASYLDLAGAAEVLLVQVVPPPEEHQVTPVPRLLLELLEKTCHPKSRLRVRLLLPLLRRLRRRHRRPNCVSR